jgi:Na+/phosphate symporter
MSIHLISILLLVVAFVIATTAGGLGIFMLGIKYLSEGIQTVAGTTLMAAGADMTR